MRKKTTLYVDGLNLHHQLEKTNPQLMWLDLFRLAERMLRKQNTISQVNYYVARFNPSKKADQQKIYLDALQSQAPKVAIHYGEFKQQIRRVKLADAKANQLPNFANALLSEEKKTDVNLASHLVRDAFLNRFEVAVVLTNDTDFVEAIRIVREEVGLPVGILSPSRLASQNPELPRQFWIHGELRKAATFHKHIRQSHLANAQFPRRIPGTKIIRPPGWD